MLIGFGRWNKYYYYILISIVTKFLKEDILGFDTNYHLIYRLKIDRHPIIILLIGFLSDFIIGLISSIYIYMKKNKKEKEKEKMKNEMEETENILPVNHEVGRIALKLKKTMEELNINNDALTKQEEDERLGSFKSDFTFKSDLIHNDVTNMNLEIITKNSLKFILISSCLILVKEIATKLVYSLNDIFDYYFLNLITIALILRFYFKEKIYKHHMLSIILVSTISGVCVISCIFLSSQKDDDENKIGYYYDIEGNYYKIFILFFAYVCISIFFCTGIIFQKNLMQFKFVRYQLILLWKGIIGVGICIIGIIISSLVKCSNPFGGGPPPKGPPPKGPPPPKFNPQNSDFWPPPPPSDGRPGPLPQKGIFDIFVCADFDGENHYYDNFISYFSHLSEKPENDSIVNMIGKDPYSINEHITIEVFIIIGYFILHFISEISLILVNKFLTPFHYLITESLYSLLHIIYQIIIIVSVNQDNDIFDNKENENYMEIYNFISKNKNTRILKIIAVFAELIGYLIYMEIIHLNFCGLNKNIKKNIEKRAEIDTIIDNISEGDYNINDIIDDNEEEKYK